ncbi:MAG: hypothetical protein LAT67_01200 [Balneolales bacterium]|nr:hypothetical protein [Balneolales bacterium]
MDIKEIKSKISDLAQKHKAIKENGLDEIKNAEYLESEAEDLIINYCEGKGYQVEGFPHEKRKINSEEYDEDYFCRERFMLYLDTLILSHQDVAELMWHYNSSFWPDFYDKKENYISEIRHQRENKSLYDVEF